MIPSASLHLLSQDNSVPGNRKDGFRYHHLLFIVIATPLYLWLELSFGVRLLDNIGGQVISQDTVSIEHWGRLISGMAVSLLFLSGWFRQCEKMNTPWPARLAVSLAISLACIVLTWWGQARVIDFYVSRSNAEITTALRVLGVTIIAGFLLLRFWIRYALSRYKRPYRMLAVGLVVIFGLGHFVMHGMMSTLPETKQNLGLERQKAATLTLVRRGLEERVYSLNGIKRPPEEDLMSAENKAFLALFPIFGSVLDQTQFERDRPELLAKLMYIDWNREHGDRTFTYFQEVVSELRQFYDTDYRQKAARQIPDGGPVEGGLSWEKFAATPAALRFLRMKAGCFDCQFTVTMDQDAFGREFHKWTQANNITRAVDTFGSATHFESGRDGERAARAYWVPIWALLFSIVGAFTHIFKMIFTVTEYAHRMTFHRVRAADSPLAEAVISNSRFVTAIVVFAMAFVIYFADNRITGHPKYIELRPLLFQSNPIAGGLAAHWTVNAQGFFYPFTSKLRPDWLTFNSDPISLLPFVSDWINEDY
jgi:hypothetical protein